MATPPVRRFSAGSAGDIRGARASANRPDSADLVGRAVRTTAGEYERLNKTDGGAGIVLGGNPPAFALIKPPLVIEDRNHRPDATGARDTGLPTEDPAH